MGLYLACGSEIKGEMLLPFFDEPVEVDIGISLDGDLTVALTSAGPNGLFKLTKPKNVSTATGWKIKEISPF